MKVKYVIDNFESSTKRDDALHKVMRELGSKVTVSGNTIEVDSWDEDKVSSILNRSGVRYSKS